MRDILKEISLDYFRLNDELSLKNQLASGLLEKDVLESKWLGFEPAGNEVIDKRERELNTSLPKSYCEFLKASNGFRSVSPFLDNLFSIEKVNWLRELDDASWFDYDDEVDSQIDDNEYLDYENQDSVWYRKEYFKHSLKISEWYDGMCIFLNPNIQHEGEWEVLEYATWYPGVMRYRNFREYLEKVHKSNLDLLAAR